MAIDRSFLKAGARSHSLEAAAADRIADAQALLGAGRLSSTMVMGIYAVETYLKVAICKRLDLDALPKAFEIHDLDSLLLLAGLQTKITLKRNRRILANWNLILEQSTRLTGLRYRPAGELSLSESDVSAFLASITDPPHGVLPWLLKRV